MSITLGDLRTFATENASPDVSDLAGDREVQLWINSAVQRVWSSADWNYATEVGRITTDVVTTGSGLTVTKGSGTLTLVGEVFQQKYVDEEWHLHVSGEGSMTFELKTIDSPTTATMKAGHVWTGDTAIGKSYTWCRHKYPLPSSFTKVTRIQHMQTQQYLSPLEPWRFDRARQTAPTQRSSDQIYYTIRGHKLELWPGPDDSYSTLLVTYRKGPATHNSDAPDDTVIDWPEVWVDLLQKAIILEAAITQGKNSPVPYAVALREYEDRLNVYKGEDAGVQYLGGPMGLRTGWAGSNYDRSTDYPSVIPEV